MNKNKGNTLKIYKDGSYSIIRNGNQETKITDNELIRVITNKMKDIVNYQKTLYGVRVKNGKIKYLARLLDIEARTFIIQYEVPLIG